MDHSSSFLTDLALVLLVASIASLLFRALRQPPLLGYLVAGLVVGPYLPFPVFADPRRIQALSEFGVVLVMFSVGLEFSVRRLMRVLPSSGTIGMVQMSVAGWVGFVVARSIGWSAVESVFLGSALAISSTMVVARVFEEAAPPARLRGFVFGVLIIQDVVAVMLIAALTAIASGSSVSAEEMMRLLGNLVAVLVAMVVIGMFVVPRFVRAVLRTATTEVIVVASAGVCFGLALLAQELGYSVALGSFLAGMLVAESGAGRRVETLIVPIRDLFAAVFFVSIGMMVDPGLAVAHGHISLLLALLVIAVQFFSVSMTGILTGKGLRTSVQAGLSLGQIGEFSFIMVGIGTAAGVLRSEMMSILVTTAVFTTFTTPLLVRVGSRMAEAIDRRLPQPLQTALSLYESWLEDLRRQRTKPRTRSRTRRLIMLLAIDGAAIAGIIIAASIWGAALRASMLDLGVPERALKTVFVGLVLIAITPFSLGVLRAAKALAQQIAAMVLPPAESGPDLANAPRRVLMVALQLLAFVAVGAPVVVLTQPFLPGSWAAGALAVGTIVLGFVLWRDARNLQGHVRAGAEVLLEIVSRQGRAADEEVPDVQDVLPGLGSIVRIHLDDASPVLHRSLAEIDLRAKTGATVVGIARGQEGLPMPAGSERLLPGDDVVLSGTTEAVAHARTLLLGDDARADG